MDPFAKFKHNNMTVESNVMKGAGKTPVWDQDFDFNVKGFSEQISVEILDKEGLGKDDSIGTATLNVDDLIAISKYTDPKFDFEIHYKGPLGLKTKCAGKVFISVKFVNNLEQDM